MFYCFRKDGGENNNQNTNGNVKNNGEENVFDQLAQILVVLVNQQPKPNIVSQFKRLNPPTFDGATDPTVAEMWIKEMETTFRFLGSNDEQKVTLAVYQIQGSAYDWWFMEKRKNEQYATTNTKGIHEQYTWAKFKKALVDKYFPRTIRVQKERDFIRLEQGRKTVSEYEAVFAKLAKYAPTLVDNESSRARRLE